VSTTANPAVVPSSHSGKNNRTLFVAISLLAVAGMAISAFSLQRHYARSATSFCEVGERFNCDIVNRSEYSTVMGIPVAGIGVLGYGALLALATVYRSRPETPLRLLSAALAGLAFALYLTYVEAYKLDTWCILCLSSLAVIAMISLLGVALKLRARVGG
jgi:vitamin-K-epoxide reductase (warfarin-sensitive)